MFGVATDRGCRTPAPAPFLWWQRFLAGRPQAGGGLDADDIGKADFCDAVAKVCVDAVAGIGQNDLGVDPSRNSITQQIKRDLWLGLEDDSVWHTCLSAAVWVISPLMREIETIGNRQAGMIIGGRQAHSDLAVILLAKLSTVLPCHTDRMLALF